MKRFFTLVGLMLLAVVMVAPTPVFADDNEMNNELCSTITDEQLKEAAGCNTTKNVPQVATNIIQAAIGVCGIVAVLVIVVAGQRFISANGDAQRVNQAKNMLIYAVIGLIIAVLSFSVVTFVSQSVNNNANTGGGSGEEGGGGE